MLIKTIPILFSILVFWFGNTTAQNPSEEQNKVSIIRIDTATFHICERLLKSGQLQKAELLAKQTLQQAKNNPGPDSVRYANAIFMQGMVALFKSRSDVAGPLLENALVRFEKQFGTLSLQVADVYNYLGLNEWNQEHLEQAANYHRQALSIRTKLLGPWHLDVAASSNNLGLIFQHTEPDTALVYFLKADSIFKMRSGAGFSGQMYTGVNIALVHYEKGYHRQAIREMESVLAEVSASLGDKHPSTAFIYCSLARFYNQNNESAKAVYVLKKAIAIYKGNYGPRHPDLATAELQLACIYENMGRPEDALITCQLALIANSTQFLNNKEYANVEVNDYLSPNVKLSCLRYKAELLEKRYLNKTLKQSDLEQALFNLEQSDSIIDRIRRSTPNKKDKLNLASIASEVYESAVRVALKLAEVGTKPHFYQMKAFYFSERSKAAVLLSSIAEASARKYANIPDSLLNQEQSLEVEINLFEKKLAEAENPNLQDEVRGNLLALNHNYNQLVAGLEKRYPAYYALKYQRNTTTVPDVQQKMDDTSAIISYLTSGTDNRIYVFFISKRHFNVYTLPFTRSILHALRGFQNCIKYQEDWGMQINGEILYKALFPFRIPKRIKSLLIIPDGELLRLPFEAIIRKRGRKKVRYLVEKYSFGYHYSVSLYMKEAENALIQRASQNLKSAGLMVCAPVSFDYEYSLGKLPNLAASEQEARYIALLANNQNIESELFLKDKAVESIMKAGTAEHFKYLHFATHGVINEDRPELSRILFSPETGSIKNDAMLFTGEIYNLKLNARLVTLSACQTGLGTEIKGEGLIGFSRALLYAGAENVIVSLWSVADESTAELMKEFYNCVLTRQPKHLNGALRQAKIKLIQSDQYKAPFYWAPFILIGE